MDFASVVLLASALAAPPETKASGLPAAGDAAAEGSQVTFCRDIAPILQERCQKCHRPGEVAPMSLLSYEDARPWARSIKKAVASRKMPPWHADPTYGKWKNDCRLSEGQIEKIVSWVDAGAPEGDPAALPAPRKFVEGWNIGEPDLVLTVPREFTVPAEGKVDYKYFSVPTHFTEDRWIQAAEARPGNRAVVHHILVFVMDRGQKNLGDGQELWSKHLCGTVPGAEADVFPPGSSDLIKAGSSLVFQIHYTTNGKETTDRSSIGLIFAKEPVKSRLTVSALQNKRFRIPPGASSHEVTAQTTIPEDVTVLSLMPHMHWRGKSFRYDAVFPDGRKETLLSVPGYDFGWQHTYRFAEPLKLPRGTRIECTAVYDNSAENKANPDPSKEVRWGDQNWQQLMLGFITYTRDSEPIREWAF